MEYTLKQHHRPTYFIQPEKSHPKLSLSRVLHVKFLRWVEKSTLHTLGKTLRRASITVLLSALVLFPQLVAGILTSTARWNGYRIPIFLAVLYCTLNARRGYLRLRRLMSSRSGNQHTFHGLPVDELASYLCENQKFTRDHAMKVLGITQPKYQKIAETLSDHGVLKRGDNNAHCLNDITREQLVRQIREDFPLVFDETRSEWVERDGTFNRWILQRERDEAKRRTSLAKLETRASKARQTIALAQGFERRVLAL